MSWYHRITALQSLGQYTQKKAPTRLGGGAYFVKPEPAIPYAKADPVSGWTPNARRTGIIAVKVGMLEVTNEWGRLTPCTVLQLRACQVIDHRTQDKHGYNALVIGAGQKKIKRTPRTELGQFARMGVPIKRIVAEFKVSPDAFVPIGTKLYARHFVPGQKVDVIGVTRGKGFQGAMKRWGFGGLFATHGVSLTHRSLGATGARQDPGKVWKGKKMAGRMGGKTVLTRNLVVQQIDTRENCILVTGCVPGAEKTWLEVTDATGYKFQQVPPFPTFTPTEEHKAGPSILRNQVPPPKFELDTEEEEWNELLQERFPLKLSSENLAKFEAIRKKYRRQLMMGHIRTIIKNEFPEWGPTKEELQEEAVREKAKQDEIAEKRHTLLTTTTGLKKKKETQKKALFKDK